MTLANIIALLGGVALFLYGMSLMGDGLRNAAGNKLELVLFELSGTRFKGVLLGTGVTAVIQSSAATSAMAVGFVNASIMNLTQAICIITGSILGTSVTGWIVALSELGAGATGWLQLLSTATLTGIIAIVGILLRMTAKTEKKKHLSSIFLGFAVLMYGMTAMSTAVAPLKSSPAFIGMISRLSNPILGFLVGIVITAILQSASSAVGLLQVLAFTGAVSFSAAFPLLLGINIGASVPVLMSAVGAKADARRAAASYPLISGLGSAVVGLVFYAVNAGAGFGFLNESLDAFEIALVNTLFRFAGLLIAFPFLPAIEKMLRRLISESAQKESPITPPLEERFLANPDVALAQTGRAVQTMLGIVRTGLERAIVLLFNYSESGFDDVTAIEDESDRYEDKIGEYIVKISTGKISTEQSKVAAEYLRAIGDLERISDHSLNIAERAREIKEKQIVFSEEGLFEIQTMTDAIREVLSMAMDAFTRGDSALAARVEPLEEVVDELCVEMKRRHVERLTAGKCTIGHGYVFNDLLTDFERISDHCSNIALNVIDAHSESFGAHDYINRLEAEHSEAFQTEYNRFRNKFKL